jgi:hypothetical protein
MLGAAIRAKDNTYIAFMPKNINSGSTIKIQECLIIYTQNIGIG